MKPLLILTILLIPTLCFADLTPCETIGNNNPVCFGEPMQIIPAPAVKKEVKTHPAIAYNRWLVDEISKKVIDEIKKNEENILLTTTWEE